MPISVILLFLVSIRNSVNRRVFAAIVCGVFVIGNLHFFIYAVEHKAVIKAISTSGWHAAGEVPLDTKVTRSGLVVYIPKKEGQCWDSPLPCTPYFNDTLRLRKPGDMAKGFTVKTRDPFKNGSSDLKRTSADTGSPCSLIRNGAPLRSGDRATRTWVTLPWGRHGAPLTPSNSSGRQHPNRENIRFPTWLRFSWSCSLRANIPRSRHARPGETNSYVDAWLYCVLKKFLLCHY